MEERWSASLLAVWASFSSHLRPLCLKCCIGEQKARKISSQNNQNNQNMLKFEKFPAMTSGDLSSSMTLLFSSTFMLNSLSPKSMESSLPKMEPPTETRISFTMSKHGPAFFGQVWSLCDDAGRGPGFVALPKTSIPIPPQISGFVRWIKRMLQEEVEDERIPFFFKDENAENYAKRLRIHGVKCRVRLYNLDSVYPFVKASLAVEKQCCCDEFQSCQAHNTHTPFRPAGNTIYSIQETCLYQPPNWLFYKYQALKHWGLSFCSFLWVEHCS